MIVRKKLRIVADNNEWRMFNSLMDNVAIMRKELESDDSRCAMDMDDIYCALKTLSDYIEVE